MSRSGPFRIFCKWTPTMYADLQPANHSHLGGATTDTTSSAYKATGPGTMVTGTANHNVALPAHCQLSTPSVNQNKRSNELSGKA